MHASMKSLIVLSCLSLSALALPSYAAYHQTYGTQAGYYHGSPAPLAHDGRVVDTPEVAHAKQAHLAAYAAEAAKAAHHSGGYFGDESDGDNYVGYHGAYHGPPAPLGHDGRVVDTPEVAHAKAAHLAAHAEEISKVAHLSHFDPYSHAKWYHFPGCGCTPRVSRAIRWGATRPTVPPINCTMHLGSSRNADLTHVSLAASTVSRAGHQDTFAEVLAAMIGHFIFFVLLSAALASPQWYGPHASPAPLGPDGRVVDTPEVAQLKAAHLSALAEANARAPRGPGPAYAGPSGSSYASGNYIPHYSGPPAPLGPDGRVVDTPEVQQAKAVHFSLYNTEARRVPAGPADPVAAGAYNPSWNNGAYNPAWDGPAGNYY
ncbi:uncharacterized protein LOC109855674 [Pseudomyrmex gracilis]|uniref:uncharacterized protein LOC109855674 n=1 Tax=Pseudomyrmex gracilis TaxID=219809 RepID=UPI0009951DC8|nr:uncharacterized protein LOC109855674 [Pseudomyrmex gracilis]